MTSTSQCIYIPWPENTIWDSFFFIPSFSARSTFCDSKFGKLTNYPPAQVLLTTLIDICCGLWNNNSQIDHQAKLYDGFEAPEASFPWCWVLLISTSSSSSASSSSCLSKKLMKLLLKSFLSSLSSLSGWLQTNKIFNNVFNDTGCFFSLGLPLKS